MLAACVLTVMLLAAWLMLSDENGSPATAPLPAEATPSAPPTASPLPGSRSAEPVEQVVPNPKDQCADADDVQVHARPYTFPSDGTGPMPSPRPLTCPAV